MTYIDVYTHVYCALLQTKLIKWVWYFLFGLLTHMSVYLCRLAAFMPQQLLNNA